MRAEMLGRSPQLMNDRGSASASASVSVRSRRKDINKTERNYKS